MILNDRQIKEHLEKGLRIEPFQLHALSPASYDLSIGSFQSINFPDQHIGESLEKDGEITILPGESFRASTIEIVGFPNFITGEIVSKSSTSRKGLFLASPGWIDPGYIGQLTVAMKNETLSPVKLTYGTKMWQVIFETCEPAEQAYTGHYQGSEGIVGDRSDAFDI
jgi:dCTP deaminase